MRHPAMSKPVASHVQGLLKLPRSMRTYDTQHVCYGDTAGWRYVEGAL